MIDLFKLVFLRYSQSFKKFGLSKTDSSLLVVEAVKPAESKIEDICDLIQGTPVPMADLNLFTDIDSIKKVSTMNLVSFVVIMLMKRNKWSFVCFSYSFKVYKVKDEELKIGSLEQAVLGRMASKPFMNF